jgi:hypothetical protein
MKDMCKCGAPTLPVGYLGRVVDPTTQVCPVTVVTENDGRRRERQDMRTVYVVHVCRKEVEDAK